MSDDKKKSCLSRRVHQMWKPENVQVPGQWRTLGQKYYMSSVTDQDINRPPTAGGPLTLLYDAILLSSDSHPGGFATIWVVYIRGFLRPLLELDVDPQGRKPTRICCSVCRKV